MKEQTKKEIEQLGRDHRCTTLAQRCIREDLTVEDTRALILEDIYGARRVESSGEIGMSARDIQQYSVLNAIRKMAGPWMALKVKPRLQRPSSSTDRHKVFLFLKMFSCAEVSRLA